MPVACDLEDNDDRPRKLRVYGGEKSRCDQCEREFCEGEVISVDERSNLVFCYSDAMGGCVMAYVFDHSRAIFGENMLYRGVGDLRRDRTPNYPSVPLRPREKRGLWRRLLNFFGLKK